MNIYSSQFEEAIRAVEFHSDTSYSWLGRRLPPISGTLKRHMKPSEARAYLLYYLQHQLYAEFYCPGMARRREIADVRSLRGMTPFVRGLSEANTGSGCEEDGWIVSAVTGDEVSARKSGPEFRMKLTECRGRNGSAIAPGDSVTVRLPKEMLNISPRFYVALGCEPLRISDAAEIIRFYWNLTPKAAAPFVHEATLLLNGAGLPFHLKVLRDPELYTRCDAGVIYVQKADYAAVSEIVMRLYASVKDRLKPGTPAFTKRLALGLGLAENPSSSQSFGEHRCGLLADAMLLAKEQGIASDRDRLAYVLRHFEHEQVKPDAPFLNAGSSDDYHFPAGL